MSTLPAPSDVLWHATAGDRPKRPALQGDLDTDVAVIGGGFLGFSTALHLAECGVSVVVLEQGGIAWGASGRNAGVVAPMLARGDPDDVVAKLGEEAGNRLNAIVAGAGDLVFELARRHGIECDAEQTGFLQPAHAAVALPPLERRFGQWQKRGKKVDLLVRDQTARATGSDIFAGALLDHSGGQINPVKYTRGLAAAAENDGVRIFEDTAVTGLDQTADGWLLRTRQGAVKATKVLMATNALTGSLWPRLHRSLMPLTVHQLATKPVGEDVTRRILPGRQAATDTSGHPFSFRYDADNRLISAAVSMVPYGAKARMSRLIRENLARRLKLSEVPEEDYIWSGTAALTNDFLPRLHQLGPGLLAAIGCNGRGIALCTALGPALAGLLAEDGEAPPLPYSEVEPISGYFLKRHGPRIYMPWANWKDARDKARNGRA